MVHLEINGTIHHFRELVKRMSQERRIGCSVRDKEPEQIISRQLKKRGRESIEEIIPRICGGEGRGSRFARVASVERYRGFGGKLLVI